jgi:hypothetical protein
MRTSTLDLAERLTFHEIKAAFAESFRALILPTSFVLLVFSRIRVAFSR